MTTFLKAASIILLCLGMVLTLFAYTGVAFATHQVDDSGDPIEHSAGGGGGANELENPIEVDDLGAFIEQVIRVILTFAVPIVVFFIMYSGFLFVTARGDASQVQTARTALTWSVVGGLIVLGAFVIVEVIQGTVDTFK